MKLTIRYPVAPARPTVGTALVADAFGFDLSVEGRGDHVVAEELELPVAAGNLVLFTGPSGSGKSSLLMNLVKNINSDGQAVLDLDQLELPAVPLIDGLGLSFAEAAGLLSACGLAEPRLMLRTAGRVK